ncbi:hypothetical protein LY78DRAFT_376324 [Colletotrichum sublineola]|nr:hypothetical protein LY78DRAFT_376324 [Colletotrichum sublineola]
MKKDRKQLPSRWSRSLPGSARSAGRQDQTCPWLVLAFLDHLSRASNAGDHLCRVTGREQLVQLVVEVTVFRLNHASMRHLWSLNWL